ncbi:cysteine hydrolase [Nisaea acidiphila]|uniref:Cysteine hydrolase n=1 Tax=Nisaea acidiphila TaxID=1862145 RepID=A0A9J7AU66_9PROT|nr:cysteine hydrolase family protein [Nisaea acidiphila]UUX50646.1 cysteine hydrolase [Nisaea acidiphila]
MQTALIVIDMQLGSFTPYSARHDTLGTVARINDLAGKVRARGMPVIFVQHDGPEGDPHHPDEAGWHMLPELDVRPGDPVVRKTSCDAFLGTDLAEVLEREAVAQVIVTGCASDYCIDTTVRAALARKIRTVVPSDTHTTANRPHLDAPSIIKHHNAIWSNFLSPIGPATVIPAAEVRLD